MISSSTMVMTRHLPQRSHVECWCPTSQPGCSDHPGLRCWRLVPHQKDLGEHGATSLHAGKGWTPPQKKVSDDWMGVLIHITAIDKADWKIYIYNMNCMELNAMRKHLWLLRSYSVKLNSLSCSRVLRYSMYKSISSSFWNAKFSSSISLKMGKDSHVQFSWRGK